MGGGTGTGIGMKVFPRDVLERDYLLEELASQFLANNRLEKDELIKTERGILIKNRNCLAILYSVNDDFEVCDSASTPKGIYSLVGVTTPEFGGADRFRIMKTDYHLEGKLEDKPVKLHTRITTSQRYALAKSQIEQFSHSRRKDHIGKPIRKTERLDSNSYWFVIPAKDVS